MDKAVHLCKKFLIFVFLFFFLTNNYITEGFSNLTKNRYNLTKNNLTENHFSTSLISNFDHNLLKSKLPTCDIYTLKRTFHQKSPQDSFYISNQSSCFFYELNKTKQNSSSFFYIFRNVCTPQNNTTKNFLTSTKLHEQIKIAPDLKRNEPNLTNLTKINLLQQKNNHNMTFSIFKQNLSSNSKYLYLFICILNRTNAELKNIFYINDCSYPLLFFFETTKNKLIKNILKLEQNRHILKLLAPQKKNIRILDNKKNNLGAGILKCILGTSVLSAAIYAVKTPSKKNNKNKDNIVRDINNKLSEQKKGAAQFIEIETPNIKTLTPDIKTLNPIREKTPPKNLYTYSIIAVIAVTGLMYWIKIKKEFESEKYDLKIY